MADLKVIGSMLNIAYTHRRTIRSNTYPFQIWGYEFNLTITGTQSEVVISIKASNRSDAENFLPDGVVKFKGTIRVVAIDDQWRPTGPYVEPSAIEGNLSNGFKHTILLDNNYGQRFGFQLEITEITVDLPPPPGGGRVERGPNHLLSANNSHFEELRANWTPYVRRSLASMFQSEQLKDVWFIHNGEPVATAHRCILAAASNKLSRLVEAHIDGDPRLITVHLPADEVCSLGVRLVVQYIYGVLYAQDILNYPKEIGRAARYFEVVELTKLLVQFRLTVLTSQSVLDILGDEYEDYSYEGVDEEWLTVLRRCCIDFLATCGTVYGFADGVLREFYQNAVPMVQHDFRVSFEYDGRMRGIMDLPNPE